MVFTTPLFVFSFFPIVLLLYFFSNDRCKNVVLLIASLFFYAWGEPKNIIIMLLSILINYFLGLCIEKYREKGKIILITAIIYNLGILFVYKYLNFTIEIWNYISGQSIKDMNIILPIGISFYTFQIMSYIIDVYRKKVKAQHNIVHLAIYISLFPQLIAGPIVRYVDIEKQISQRKCTLDYIYIGILRFCIGFSKKILIADQLSKFVDIVFGGSYPSIISNWIGIIAYALQIYFDFSGYSDMAIGMGKMFGFDFQENFNYPYISKSVQEFWRRWHISLSTWFRDYLYIPLGGSREGKYRTYLNLMLVFFLTGLWHGASFNFIAWGLFYAAFLIFERTKYGKGMLNKMPNILKHIYTLGVVLFGWVFFRSSNIETALSYIYHMFIPYGCDFINFNYIINSKYIFWIIVGIFFSIPRDLGRNVIGEPDWRKSHICYFDIIVYGIFLVAICTMVGSGYSPFLYFRF